MFFFCFTRSPNRKYILYIYFFFFWGGGGVATVCDFFSLGIQIDKYVGGRGLGGGAGVSELFLL